ncbi:MAG TPA: S4 domain-containing protein, partial [Terriglobales bacterium]|nr:S4 domain-containing protein [Terriglobales bacterium]
SQVVVTTPILEGWRQGNEKMSKSLDNAIGIFEPPLEMYGKIMAISDERMWRYYELLTDVSAGEIEKMKRDAAGGQAHPMNLKKELARRIVADFHSGEAAKKAAEDWARQFQKNEVPEEAESVSVPHTEVASKEGGIRVDKLLVRIGMASSVSEAGRKIKEKAVRVNGEVALGNVIPLRIDPAIQTTVSVRLGRKLKKVTVTP